MELKLWKQQQEPLKDTKDYESFTQDYESFTNQSFNKCVFQIKLINYFYKA